RRDDRPRDAAGTARAAVSRGGCRALPLPRRQRRDRRHRLGLAAILRRLHAGAYLGGRAAVYVPLRRHRPRPAQAATLGAERRGDQGVRATGLVAPERPLFRAAGIGDAWARPKAGDVVHRRLAGPPDVNTTVSSK